MSKRQRKTYTHAQRHELLGQIERERAAGRELPAALKEAGISEGAYYRWRADAGRTQHRRTKTARRRNGNGAPARPTTELVEARELAEIELLRLAIEIMRDRRRHA